MCSGIMFFCLATANKIQIKQTVNMDVNTSSASDGFVTLCQIKYHKYADIPSLLALSLLDPGVDPGGVQGFGPPWPTV